MGSWVMLSTSTPAGTDLLPPACSKTVLPVTAYTAIIPAILQSGSKQSIPVALFAGDAPTSAKVSLTLIKDGKQISSANGNIDGNGLIPVTIPDPWDRRGPGRRPEGRRPFCMSNRRMG